MALIERPRTPRHWNPRVATAESTYGAFRRPVESTGWKSWLFTIDHKKLGIMYGAVALFFFVVGGVEALLIRAAARRSRRHDPVAPTSTTRCSRCTPPRWCSCS